MPIRKESRKLKRNYKKLENSKKFKTYLQKKIRINMNKWKSGRWVSQQQALAVSYSQTRLHFSKRNKGQSKRNKGQSKRNKGQGKRNKSKSKSKK